MDQDQIKKYYQIIKENFGVEDLEISNDLEFIADLNGSLEEIKSFITTLEEKYDVEVNIKEINNNITVGHLKTLIEESQI
ncbi:hypothetical protein ACFL1M_00025 [Patescibacteria group bacterium]